MPRPILPPPVLARSSALGRCAGAARAGWLALLIAILLLADFFLRLPTAQVADWGQFAFYDPGTVLKGDILLSKGYMPTLDFGYTHGLLSLLYGHLGFAILGRTAVAYFVLTLLTEMVMAWALARVLIACRLTRMSFLLFLLALPMAIMPAYLTLTHPLEAMFILLALAAQAEGRRGQALALMTVCLFVKPSMAYVYGFLLVVMILWGARLQFSRFARRLVPAVIVFLALFGGLTLWMGARPVMTTLLPVTGAKTYAAMEFGFFATSGRQFWLPAHPFTDFITPAAFFLLAAGATACGAIWSVVRLLTHGRSDAVPAASLRRYELLFTLGALHTAFLLGFYGWTGSWTYYAYLPMLGLVLVFTLLPLRRTARVCGGIVLFGLVLLAHVQLVGDIAGNWEYKIRSAQTGNLWAYPEQIGQWRQAVDATTGRPTLVMTNGTLPNLPANVELPDAWFPEPGIPTASEIERVKGQASRVTCVILWWEYRAFDLWNSPEFAGVRGDFHPIYHNERFTVLQRN